MAVGNVSVETVHDLETPRWIEILTAVWLILVVCIGSTLNVLVLMMFAKCRKMVTPFTMLLITLFILDLIMCLVAPVLPIIAELSSGWYRYLSHELCLLEAFMVFFIGLTSIFLLTGIAISRNMVVQIIPRPLNWRKEHSVITIVTSLALAMFFCILPFLGLSSYGLEIHQTSCGLSWRDKSDEHIVYIFVLSVACYILPISIMVICYSTILKKFRQSVADDQRATVSQFSALRQRRLVYLSLVIVGAFVVAWTPYAIVSFYQTFSMTDNSHPLLTRVCAMFAKSEAAFNPALYIVTVKDAREKIVAMVPGINLILQPGRSMPPRARHVANIAERHLNARVSPAPNGNVDIDQLGSTPC